MEWLQSITKAVRYIEDNLTNEISVDDVSNHVFLSPSHFARIFNLGTGITIGDYIRNRRLSLAGRDLLLTKNKVIDVAMRYQYDTSESFSKAFSRFHGIAPSAVKEHSEQLKFFTPLVIKISIQGGFEMSRIIMENTEGSILEREVFEYRRLGKTRFIGIDAFRTGEDWGELWLRRSEFLPKLDALKAQYAASVTENCGLKHHNGGSFGDENLEWHFLTGYFFKADTPVPEGFDYYDVPTENAAYAVYIRETTDAEIEPAYQFTRDQILSDGFIIPYPKAYWYAEVFENGWETDLRFGYLMAVDEFK
ncbi:MAG: AraC family transcriptional regulator [Oscillospiraceae bacterium]